MIKGGRPETPTATTFLWVGNDAERVTSAHRTNCHASGSDDPSQGGSKAIPAAINTTTTIVTNSRLRRLLTLLASFDSRPRVVRLRRGSHEPDIYAVPTLARQIDFRCCERSPLRFDQTAFGRSAFGS